MVIYYHLVLNVHAECIYDHLVLNVIHLVLNVIAWNLFNKPVGNKSEIFELLVSITILSCCNK